MTALQINKTSHKILVDSRKEKYDFHSFCLKYCSIGINTFFMSFFRMIDNKIKQYVKTGN